MLALLAVLMEDSFVAPGAKIEKLPQAFRFTEGPVWTKRKTLLFSDIPANRIYEWDGKEVKVFREPSFNSNGLTLDKKGNLYTCEHGSRVVRKTDPSGNITVIASEINGKKLNSPNDIAIHPRTGVIAFSDPSYGIRPNQMEYGKKSVFILDPETEKLTEFVVGEDQPNGVVFSSRGTHLFVADSGAGTLSKFTYPGGVSEWKVKAPSADGIRIDNRGNVWAACADGVRVYDQNSGSLLETIPFPEAPANLCFAEDGSTLYVTARTGVYSLKLRIKGVMPGF